MGSIELAKGCFFKAGVSISSGSAGWVNGMKQVCGPDQPCMPMDPACGTSLTQTLHIACVSGKPCLCSVHHMNVLD